MVLKIVQYSATFFRCENRKSSVVDPHLLDADPDSTYHSDADPDSDLLFDADPDPDPDPSFKKRLKPLKKC